MIALILMKIIYLQLSVKIETKLLVILSEVMPGRGGTS